MLFETMSNMKQRLTMSAFGIVIVLFSITFSTHPIFRPIFALLVAITICLALWEYYHIAHGRGLSPLTKVGLGGSALYTYTTFLSIQHGCCEVLPQISLWLTLLATFGFFFTRGKDPFINIATTIFGLCYITLPLTLILSITYFFKEGTETSTQDGRWWLLYLILITKITDAGAFFVGKRWGNRKLASFISPNKTWEGAIGGLCSAVIASLLFYHGVNLYFDTPPISINYFESVWIAICISMIAQVGDLAESLLKRDVGVKDSSHLPGLGGMLDVLDSMIFTTPFLFFLLTFLY